MVPLVRIGLTTPSLPRKCSTTEPQRHKRENFNGLALNRSTFIFKKKGALYPFATAAQTRKL